MNVVETKTRLWAAIKLLEQIQEGYEPAETEKEQLLKLTELNLTGKQVLTLQKGASYLSCLQKLAIVGTDLAALPVNLGQLTALRQLIIYGNNLSSIPYTINQLQNLKVLKLTSNQLQILPGAICQLTGLEELTLCCPNLQVLPKKFGQMRGLRKLDIRSQAMQKLSGKLYRLKNLEILSVDCDTLKELPDAIGSLTYLKKLRLITKNVDKLPDTIGGLSALEELTLSSSAMCLPAGFGRLSSLRELYLNCGYVEMPDEMASLVSLKRLELENRVSQDLPQAIFKLPELRELKLICPLLDKLPNRIQKLSKLQRLELQSYKLAVLSPGFCKLRRLQQLTLICPELVQLPEGLGQMANLQKLYVDAAALKTIPNTINKLEHLEELIFVSSALEGLPAQIGALTNLRKLHVGSPSLRKLPDELGQLVNLEELSFAPCALEILPNTISRLVNMKAIKICSDELRHFSDALRELTNLQSITLNSRLICAIPKWVGGLTELRELNLCGSGIDHLPDSLASLNRLKKLMLTRTKLSVLPDWVSRLSELEELLINETEIREIPISLFSLEKLVRLNLSGLRLHSLPKEVLELKLPFLQEEMGETEEGICLYNTTLSTQPISLFEQPVALIREYYDTKQVPVNEAKVIFLGDGSVGKTYTILRMLNNCKKETKKHSYPTTETHGILIKPYHVERDDQCFDIHFWDFGGQDIMHSMHRCFLTERTCYVVMVSTRTPDLTTGRARYWLRNIESFAHNAPVILAVNRWGVDSPHTGLDISRLQQEFPNLVQCVSYSAKSSSVAEFRKLERAIVEQARKLDSCNMSFPEQWDGIRQELLCQATNDTYYIGREKYHDICDKHGLSKNEGIRSWLLEWFNDLGICFSYHQDSDQKELDDYKILDPEWLTSAIYRIIFGQGEVNNGTITIEEIRRILSEKGSPELSEKGIPCLDGVSYSNEECSYVLEIMRKFKVSYRVSSGKEFIPALCNENTPKNLVPGEREYWGSVKLEYHYLPDSVVHQLMIAVHSMLQQEKCWRKGLYVDWDEGKNRKCSAAVYMTGSHSEYTELQIDVYEGKELQKDTPQILLWGLLTEIAHINDTMNLQAELMVRAEKNEFSEWFSVKKIQKCKERGSYEMQGEDENYTIAGLVQKFGLSAQNLSRIYGNISSSFSDLLHLSDLHFSFFQSRDLSHLLSDHLGKSRWVHTFDFGDGYLDIKEPTYHFRNLFLAPQGKSNIVSVIDDYHEHLSKAFEKSMKEWPLILPEHGSVLGQWPMEQSLQLASHYKPRCKEIESPIEQRSALNQEPTEPDMQPTTLYKQYLRTHPGVKSPKKLMTDEKQETSWSRTKKRKKF